MDAPALSSTEEWDSSMYVPSCIHTLYMCLPQKWFTIYLLPNMTVGIRNACVHCMSYYSTLIYFLELQCTSFSYCRIFQWTLMSSRAGLWCWVHALIQTTRPNMSSTMTSPSQLLPALCVSRAACRPIIMEHGCAFKDNLLCKLIIVATYILLS